MPKLIVDTDVVEAHARLLYVSELQGLLSEYEQHIRNEALKTLRNIYYTKIKTWLSISKGRPDLQGEVKKFEKRATTILNGPLFDFEAAIKDLNYEAQSSQLYQLVIFPNKDLLVIKQKQDGIKILQETLKDNGNPASTKLDNFMRAYQSDTFHGHAQGVLKTPTLFAQRRHQDSALHNFWTAVDAILTKLGFGVSTQGVTGAKVDKKIWGMFEKAGVKKADMEKEQEEQEKQEREQAPPLGL